MYFQIILKSHVKELVSMGLVFQKFNSLMESMTVVTILMKVTFFFIYLMNYFNFPPFKRDSTRITNMVLK